MEPPDNPQTGEQLYQRSSHTVTQVLGPTTGFPNLGIWQRDWEPPGNLIWRPVGFDYRTFTGLGNRLLESTNKTLCTPRPRTKEQWPCKKTELNLPVSVQESLEETWVNSGLLRGQGYWIQQCWHKFFWRERTKGGNTAHQKNWIKYLLNMEPCIRTKPRFLHSQSFPSGSFHKPLILIHQRADNLKTIII